MSIIPLSFSIGNGRTKSGFDRSKKDMLLSRCHFGSLTRLTHMLFVDDVLIFCHCVVADCQTLKNILTIFSAMTGNDF
jgi:hypothetical protein